MRGRVKYGIMVGWGRGGEVMGFEVNFYSLDRPTYQI